MDTIKKPKIFLLSFLKIYLYLSCLGVRRLPKVKGLFGFIYGKVKDKKGIIMVKTNGHKMYIDLADQIIATKLIQYGFWEEGLTKLVKKIIKNDMFVIDVGAHMGYYSLLFSKHVGDKGKVFSFEPVPYNFNFLKENKQINKINNIVLENFAVSDKNGEIKLFLDKNNLGAHSFIEGNNNKDDCVVAKAIRLDDYFNNSNFPIDLIKIDVEGAESVVLGGMPALLNNNPNIIMIIEFCPEIIVRAGSSPVEFIDKLLAFDFHIAVIDHKSGVLKITDNVDEIVELCGKGLINILCLRDEKLFNYINKQSSYE